MKNYSNVILSAGIVFGLSLAAQAGASPMQDKVKAAMKLEYRTDADTERDRNRDPVRAVEFWGLKSDMKVIEFGPGNGWYTKILAPVLKANGKLYLASKAEWLNDLDPILKDAAASKAVKLPIDLDWNGKERRYVLGSLDFEMNDVDMVLNIREYHNFNLEDKAKLNSAAFNALKPGGAYVIVDHSRRHMAPETRELGRREDAVKVIVEVQGAGFVLADTSDMFYRPDDGLIYEVGRKSVTGNTDRFSLVFKKPK